MDRLSFVVPIIFLVGQLLSGGCQGKEGSAPPPPPSRRVVSVQAQEITKSAIEGFCDVTPKQGIRTFAWPALDPGGPQPESTRNVRWVNVWATWCKPCIKEMPMLFEWTGQLKKQGLAMSLDILSADEDAETLATFAKSHPEIPRSVRFQNPTDHLGPWMKKLGLDEGSGLPIHIFVGANNQIRCVRAAAISPGDFDTIAKLLE